MTFRNLSILQKIGLVVFVMGLSSLVIGLVGARGLSALESAMVSVGTKEEVAREAMDLRVDIIAISRMTYQLAAAPEKAADFRAEADKRSGEMLARLPKIEAAADATEVQQLGKIRQTLESYFASIRSMVDVAEADPANGAAIKAALGVALDGQKVVTASVKEYSTYSGEALASARAAALAESNMAMLVVAAAIVACIVFGAVVSLLVARRGIATPVRDLTAAMSRLAEGNLAETGTDATRKDEIGEMARAVEVFRTNALSMRDMKAQEEALHARSSDLQSSISTVVAAAVAGDFTARIRKDYGNADLNRFAGSVNELVDSIDHAVTEVRRVIAALADADLSQAMEGSYQGAFAELQSNVNATMVTLRSTMSNVRGSAGTIKDSSSELSSAANDLSKRTEQQAAALEETAAALDEITATVRTSAQRANEARDMVRETKDSAGKSGEIVRSAVSAMGRIEESSSKISQIIGVIDEIAFQTNLLALNAGVEAARAGEAGRGFAVVAQEVRELAQRSANAAKEIKNLISASAAEVGGGVSLVRATGDALVEIEQLVLRVNDHVESIATAAREQSTALAEINTSVNHMDQMTQKNAAMVEETTAASETLAEESRQLQTLLARFKLEDGAGSNALASMARRMRAA
ncbi:MULTISPECIES: methyl-accepting chemotaxis protein [unclassified Rhizobium]|uniref:methyl-accepting chemotaxis protein n=1 Tax=unclassified Rhizobium TaxID=2613769 RepID=UPI0007156D1C|nr:MULTISPECIES: methyl-accepting chemotaxis protein [unclassified Rhizobium]KQS96445.1 chemotaxis protein [Rhizobium sp. Leaf386]KQT06284.1 chemotaxis protein [Rhizobium sp. Leaf391]KQU09481.1 chemotaxis protein [Rhizobium sp. Leaf453]